jgi:REP element-mobilizing transposase RayT
MPSTHVSLHYHLVISTRNREPWLPPSQRPRVHDYLSGILRGMNGVPHAVGGMGDHIHLFAGLRATHCLADVMRELKSESSNWIHKHGLNLVPFGSAPHFSVAQLAKIIGPQALPKSVAQKNTKKSLGDAQLCLQGFSYDTHRNDRLPLPLCVCAPLREPPFSRPAFPNNFGKGPPSLQFDTRLAFPSLTPSFT